MLEPADIDAVVEVLRSGWITSGARVEALEHAFTRITGAKHAVAVSSATAGMHLVLHALGIGPGDEVITPSMTWVSTVNLVHLSGATPVFVDVDRETLMSSADVIAAAVTKRTRLIIPVHYAGAPLDLDPIRDIERTSGVRVIEDAAHALGTHYAGVPVGQSGTAVFSLQATKNVTTAEGGVICTDDDELATGLRSLRFHGLAQSAFDRQSKGRLPNAEVTEPGFKCNLPDINACLALGQLDRLADINSRREQLAERYLSAFAGNRFVMPLGLPGYPHRHAWHLFIVRLDTDRLSIERDTVMVELKERGIATGMHFRPVHLHRFYQKSMPAMDDRLVNTDWNADRIMTLPLFPAMSESDVDRVVHALDEITTRYAA
jgi:UDP-4-amino-4-deoxy-L-arabinose-oxoglutarate aminotransferase